MNYFALPGTIFTSNDYTIHPTAHLVIGGYAIQESGTICQVTSLAHAEVLTDLGAKLITVNQSVLDKVNKNNRPFAFRNQVNLGESFEKFKRATIFK